jgi:hypothetical protein
MHQPHDVLEKRLINHKKGDVDSALDAFKAMGKGVKELWTTTPGRALLAPIQAGCVIAAALNLTTALLAAEKANADLPEGEITARSSLAVPAALILMELIATQAFGTLLHICDAIWSRVPQQEPVGHAFIEEIQDEDMGSSTGVDPPGQPENPLLRQRNVGNDAAGPVKSSETSIDRPQAGPSLSVAP